MRMKSQLLEGVINLEQLQVINQNGKLLVDSRDVAEMIQKNHKELLRSIRNYMVVLGKRNFAPAEFFIESYYNDAQGKPRLHYLITKKGCDMVANKMTGEKGILFTATYVSKFEEMEKQIAESRMDSYMFDDPVKRAEKWIVEEKERQALKTQNLMLEQRVAEYEPKASYVDTILKSKNAVTITQIAKDYGLSGQQLNKILHEEKVQYKQNGQWLLYRQHHDKGYTRSQTIDVHHNDGSVTVKMNTKWTQKGRLFIHEILKKRNIVPTIDRDKEVTAK